MATPALRKFFLFRTTFTFSVLVTKTIIGHSRLTIRIRACQTSRKIFYTPIVVGLSAPLEMALLVGMACIIRIRVTYLLI